MNYATLNVLSGPLHGQTLRLHQREMTIGCDDACDLKLHGYSSLAARHARLVWDGQHFQVRDLSGDGGTGAWIEGRSAPRHAPPRHAPPRHAPPRHAPPRNVTPPPTTHTLLPSSNEPDNESATTGPGSLRAGECIELGDFVARLWLPQGGPQFVDAIVVDARSVAVSPSVQVSTVARSAAVSNLKFIRSVVTAFCVTLICLAGVWRLTSSLNGTLEKDTMAAAQVRETAPLNSPRGTPVYNLSPEIAEKAKAATVFIARRVSGGWMSGSGFVTGDGYRLVTNRHVVVDDTGQPQPCLLVFNCGTAQQSQQEIQASSIKLAPQLAGEEFNSDLAVISLTTYVAAPLPMGRAEDLTVASTVYALGFPMNLGMLPDNNTLPAVAVAAESVDRLQQGAAYGTTAVTILQLGGAVTHGNSGGPVINEYGQVVGVISRGDTATGTAFAVPSVYVNALL